MGCLSPQQALKEDPLDPTSPGRENGLEGGGGLPGLCKGSNTPNCELDLLVPTLTLPDPSP